MVTATLLSAGLGMLVGLIMGLTGAGGGILAVPLLAFGLHLTVPEAGPIGLMAVGLAAATAAVVGLRANRVRYRAAALIAGTGILAAPAGVWLSRQLDTHILSIVFAVVLLFVSYKSFKDGRRTAQPLPSRRAPPCIRAEASGRFVWTTQCAVRLSLAGGLAGLLSGLLGVGGGFVMVPALQRYTDLTMQSVIATSLAVIALISLTGVVTSMSSGHFNFAVGIPFTGGTLAGMVIGGAIAPRLASKHLKLAFALISSAVAVGLLVANLR
jgi:uncharacterized membrane protein YfcA